MDKIKRETTNVNEKERTSSGILKITKQWTLGG